MIPAWCSLLVSTVLLPGQVQEPPVHLGPPVSARDSADVQSTVDDVLSAREYRHLVQPKKEEEAKLPGWLERFLDWLFGGQSGRTTTGPNMDWMAILLQGIAYLVAIAILVLIVVVIVRGILENLPARVVRRAVGAEHSLILDTPPGELPSDEYVRLAMASAAAGDHKAAIRHLLLGAMSWIERAGLIRFRRGLTNRDYLRAVWRRPTCRDSMNGIVDAFDRTYFGRRAATSEMFDRCLKLYRLGFAANETTAMAS